MTHQWLAVRLFVSVSIAVFLQPLLIAGVVIGFVLLLRR
jgi:hypothetical protein